MRIWWTVSTHLGPNILTKKTPHYILWYRCLLLHVIYPCHLPQVIYPLPTFLNCVAKTHDLLAIDRVIDHVGMHTKGLL